MKTGIRMNVCIEKLADLPFYTEGPAIDKNGNIYYTTLHGKSVFKMDQDHRSSEWAISACPNGQLILPGGDHLICDSQSGLIKRFTEGGIFVRNEIENIHADCRVYAPNDLVVDNEGNLYFTDSIRMEGKVFYYGADGSERVVCENLDYPNGLTLSPDQQWLYVTESYKNRVLKISLRHRHGTRGYVLADLPRHVSGRDEDNLPDGLTTDSDGYIWVAHHGMHCIQVISPQGELCATIDVGIPLVSNLIFRAEHELIVTGGYGEPGPGAVLRLTF